MTVTVRGEWDLDALGNFLQAVLDWKEEQARMEQGGKSGVGEVVSGRSLDAGAGELPHQRVPRRKAAATQP